MLQNIAGKTLGTPSRSNANDLDDPSELARLVVCCLGVAKVARPRQTVTAESQGVWETANVGQVGESVVIHFHARSQPTRRLA
jgi:hypothetical protein